MDVAPPGTERKQVRRSGFHNKAEAQWALTEVLSALDHGTFVAPDAMTVGEYLTGWVATLGAAGRRPSTVHSYAQTGPTRSSRRGVGFLWGGARPPVQALIEFIDVHRQRFGVEPICRVLTEHGCKIAPNTYWVAKKRGPSKRARRDEELMVEIRRIYDENLFVYGADNEGIRVGGVPRLV